MIKKIEGYNGAYGVDELGNVWSYRKPGSKTGELLEIPYKKATYQGKVSKYLMVSLYNNGEHKNALVHRLVAETFIPNPNNLPEVDHLNKNIFDNSITNLEWVDRKENIKRANNDMGSLNGLRTKTKLYNPEGELIGDFPSKTAAARYAADYYNCSFSGMQKYGKSPSGYYLEMEYNPNLTKISQKLKKEWELYNPENEFIATFPSIRQAGLYVKNNIRDISVKLFTTHKKAYGYYVKEKGVETISTS